MKVLLIGVNASYMHTCLAVRSIKNYVEKFAKDENQDFEVNFIEFTINQPMMEILKNISKSKADVLVFSTYIWNCQIIENIIPDVKKILPNCIVGAGGPEFSYGWKEYFKRLPSLDFILQGEGESLSYELFKAFNQFSKKNSLNDFFCQDKIDIKGIYFRNNFSKEICFTSNRLLMNDLDAIPFSYPELLTSSFELDNKIYYYESSRGCPYSCSYCLSSVDKTVRFKSLEKVFKELKFFLDAKVRLVKFVDRTYNLKPDRYISIWKYILENHNHKTMFHFEIEAEYLTEEALEFLQTVPKEVMQFEIGVQSANKKTLKAINRSDNIELLSKNIKRIPRTIHQHLDLIAGLPFEDIKSFGKSFDYVMELKPDALQLGFLKILNGTKMQEFAKENGWKWQEKSVYEVFSTPYMPFEDISFLKDIELLVDEFWNKKIFSNTMKFIFRKISPWKFFSLLCKFAQEKKSFDASRKDLYWFNLLNEFFNDNFLSEYKFVLKDLIKYDFVLTGKKGNFPDWYEHRYDKEKHRLLLEQNGMLHSTRLAFAMTEFETFDFDVKNDFPEKSKSVFEYLIIYTEGRKI